MEIKGISLKSIIPAGLIAGYVMFFIDHWLGGFLGLFGLYPGTSDIWWMILHHIDSVIFAMIFAIPFVYRILPGAGWLKGAIFGLAWMIFVSLISIISGDLGAAKFSGMTFTLNGLISSVILHTIWGAVLGMLYMPPRMIVSEARQPSESAKQRRSVREMII